MKDWNQVEARVVFDGFWVTAHTAKGEAQRQTNLVSEATSLVATAHHCPRREKWRWSNWTGKGGISTRWHLPGLQFSPIDKNFNVVLIWSLGAGRVSKVICVRVYMYGIDYMHF